MSDSLNAARSVVATASALSPALGGRAALAMFFRTRPRMAVRPDDRPTHDRARRDTVRVRDLDLVTYEWGRGDDTVLLAHGWHGRASQFATLVRDLAFEGLHVVAFDAPGHGDSPGRRTDVRDWVAAIEQLQRRHGRFRTVVGHSFGALAALTAVRLGTVSGSVATISGAGTPTAFVDEFAKTMRLDAATRRHFDRGFLRRIGEDEASLARRYDAIAHPLPAGARLLAVHDDGDRQVPASWSARLVAAHGDRAQLLRTRGFGHTRVLTADPVLDALLALCTAEVPPAQAPRDPASVVPTSVTWKFRKERDAVGPR